MLRRYVMVLLAAAGLGLAASLAIPKAGCAYGYCLGRCFSSANCASSCVCLGAGPRPGQCVSID